MPTDLPPDQMKQFLPRETVPECSQHSGVFPVLLNPLRWSARR